MAIKNIDMIYIIYSKIEYYNKLYMYTINKYIIVVSNVSSS